MIAHSTGEYPGGISVPEPTESEPTGGNGGRSLKRTLSVVSSPQKSQRMMYLQDRLPGSDSPNFEPSQNTMLDSPAKSDVAPSVAPEPETPAAPEGAAPAHGGTSMMLPPPVPNRPEEKDALFWKFPGLTVGQCISTQWQTYNLFQMNS